MYTYIFKYIKNKKIYIYICIDMSIYKTKNMCIYIMNIYIERDIHIYIYICNYEFVKNL